MIQAISPIARLTKLSSNKDMTVVLKRPIIMTQEQCLEFINDDELVEVTPNHIRLRKRILDTVERYLSEDYFVIDDIFNKAKKNDIDNSIKQIIENNALSLDIKDSQLQIIIETDDFQQRANRQKETFSKIKDLFNARGHNFAELCLSEINNQ